MALVKVDFISESLERTVTIQAIIPIDKFVFPGMPKPELKPLKTLYLLHGILGNHTDWISGTRVQRWAEENNLAVIMPAGENGFYVDNATRPDLRFGEFVGKELVEFTRKLFPLSHKHEDTFIAGLSMGGYGAIRNGLKYADTFSCIGGFSSALVIDEAKNATEDARFTFKRRSALQGLLGDLDKLEGSDKDVKALALERKRQGKTIPKLYLCCGNEDFLLPQNRDYVEFLKKQEIPYSYVEGPGGHDWDYWDLHIHKFIEWLPLECNSKTSRNSGNVGIDGKS